MPTDGVVGVPLCGSINASNLTDSGRDMSGVIALAEALKVNTSLLSVRWNASDPHPIPTAFAHKKR